MDAAGTSGQSTAAANAAANKTQKVRTKKNAAVVSSGQKEPFPERSVKEKEKLIATVAEHIILWKNDEENYHNRDQTRNAWDSVSFQVGFSVPECKLLWKNLRTSFGTQLRKAREGKSGDGLDDVAQGSKAKQWVFYEQMRFLTDSMSFRKTESSFEDQSELIIEDDQDNQIGQNDSQLHMSSTSTSPMNLTGQYQPKNRKRAKSDDFLEKLTQHMDVVGKVLCEPSETNSNDRFVKYLCSILDSVPPGKKRKCESDILTVANSYADVASICQGTDPWSELKYSTNVSRTTNASCV